jgi:ketosteroid isomerase-like protein
MTSDEQQIKHLWKSGAAKARIEPKQQVKDLGISGDLAYAWSHMTVVFTPKAGGWQLARAAKLFPSG